MKKWKPKGKEEEGSYKSFCESNKINEYLRLGVKGPSRVNYRICLRGFFIFNRINDPDNYLGDPRKMSRSDELDYKEKIEHDIREYIVHLVDGEERRPAPKTLLQITSAIKGLLTFYRTDLDRIFWKNIGNGGIGKSTTIEKRTPNNQDLHKILMNADPQKKALFLIQATSGCRISEVLSIRMSDLDISFDCPRFLVRYNNAKNKKPSRKRMSPEAKEALIEYIKVRDGKIKTARSRGKTREYDPDLLFQMSEANATIMWNNIVRKAGFEKFDSQNSVDEYRRRTMTTHSLRRFFKTQFGKFDRKWAKIFCNHGDSLDEIYDDYTDEELDEIYSQGVKYLLIEKIPIDTDIRIRRMNKEIESIKEERDLAKDKLDLLVERIKGSEKRLSIVDELVTLLKDEEVSLGNSKPLSEEAKQYEERLERKATDKALAQLKKKMLEEPEKYEDREIVICDGRPTTISTKGIKESKEEEELWNEFQDKLKKLHHKQGKVLPDIANY